MSRFGDWPVAAEDASVEDVQASLEAAELGDGLPLVPPTGRRLAAMLAGVGAPDEPLGQVPPLFGELTPAAVVYNCVLAGCRPGELDVVLTALTACLESEFNLLGLLTTTGSAAVATLVHGPVAERLRLSDGINCLGPGNRANASIGRAVSLCLRNIGGARAGVGDMATLGQPGKYTFCLAESRAGILPSLAERRGLAKTDSAVSVLGVSGSIEVLPREGGETAAHILEPVAAAAMSAHRAGSGQPRPPHNELVLLLPPELASKLTASGQTLASIQHYLFERTPGHAAAPADIHPIVAGGPGIKMALLPLWGGGSRTVTRPLLSP